MNAAALSRLTVDELVERFADAAKRAGTVFSDDQTKLSNTDRGQHVREMQELGGELRKRNPGEKLWPLLDAEDKDVRGNAGAQFLSIAFDRATAALTSLAYDLSTQEVLAWRDRILRDAPSQPPVPQMATSQIVERFIDSCERAYGSARFLTNEQGGGPDMPAHTKISGEIYSAAKELHRRDELAALVPLLDHPLVTVRQMAARYCLPLATEPSMARLQQIEATQELPEAFLATLTLVNWRSQQYNAFPDDPAQMRV